MWKDLPIEKRNEYKRMILGYAALTPVLSQKAPENAVSYTPIINSKYQETIFQKVFGATPEDIGNTSFDASLQITSDSGEEHKYLIGLKTFSYENSNQKIAQFKGKIDTLAEYEAEIKENSYKEDGSIKSKSREEINRLNKKTYPKLANAISAMRNERIRSARAEIRGFKAPLDDTAVEQVYHVLMPSNKNDSPKIMVGETSYSEIDIDNIEILGCTEPSRPQNFKFSDGRHTYSYTEADHQLSMDFNNSRIVEESWDVRYADDAYEAMRRISDSAYGEETASAIVPHVENQPNITESYEWPLINEDGEVEKFSGFNQFYGVGSRIGKDYREGKIQEIVNDFNQTVGRRTLNAVEEKLRQYLLEPAGNRAKREDKAILREEILGLASRTENVEFEQRLESILYRPVGELYIPIPDARQFHEQHPDFFAQGAGELNPGTSKLHKTKEERSFNLVFEPSGQSIRCFITQDYGKGIESCRHENALGEWILRGVFRLEEHEPLTVDKLYELGINGIQVYRTDADDDVHIRFIWDDGFC